MAMVGSKVQVVVCDRSQEEVNGRQLLNEAIMPKIEVPMIVKPVAYMIYLNVFSVNSRK